MSHTCSPRCARCLRRSTITSLPFAVFLFAFAAFLAFAPMRYIEPGVSVISDAGYATHGVFLQLAQGTQDTVVGMVQEQIALADRVGSLLSDTGQSAGSSLARSVHRIRGMTSVALAPVPSADAAVAVNTE